MGELAGRGGVDVLAAGDELHVRVFKGEGDRQIVQSIPGQAVDLVDDQVVDRLFGQVGKHPLQLGPVGRARGLPLIHEFLDNHCAE
ncbi:MAG: hypothetical protein WB565_13355 [Acidimicrobiales bacterium]